VFLADDLSPKFFTLLLACNTANLSVGHPNSQDAQASALRAFLQAHAEGWLHEGLQQLGSKVWAAWPQKWACNDDRCLEMSGLDENSCSGMRCSGCRVSVGTALAGCMRIDGVLYSAPNWSSLPHNGDSVAAGVLHDCADAMRAHPCLP
jgi:hypothetical protein